MDSEKSNFKKATTAKEVERYARERGLIIDQTGSHHGTRITAPDGSRSVSIPNHGNRKGLATGTRHFLLKFIEEYGIQL